MNAAYAFFGLAAIIALGGVFAGAAAGTETALIQSVFMGALTLGLGFIGARSLIDMQRRLRLLEGP